MPACRPDGADSWRRYDIGAVLQGHYTKPTIEKEREQSISGRVRAVFADKPVSGAEVVLAITKQGHVDSTVTDSTGHFEFRGLNYPDVGFMLLCSNILNVGAGRITADDMYKSDIDRIDLYMGSKAWVFGEDMVSGVVSWQATSNP